MKDKIYQMPIMIKAMEIVKLAEGLDKLIPEDNEYLQATRGFMLENAFIIPAKIAGAEGGNLYDLRMENAAIIRKAARELSVQAGSLRFEEGINADDYITLIRKEIDEFRLLFIEWVASFDINNYIPDSWGLFNPPGVYPEDFFKDDDGNFNPMDFFEDDDE
jgi:hypothetical protein